MQSHSSWLGYVLVVVCLLSYAHSQCPSDYTPVSKAWRTALEEVEDAVLEVALAYRTSFNSRCSTIQSCTCSHDMCSESVGSMVCSKHGGSQQPGQCAYSCNGIAANMQESAVNRAGSASKPTSQDEEEMICATKSMDDTFKQLQQDLDGILYSYVGTYNGIIRMFPGQQWECGLGYDPRIRPWYRAASSGPKDVVIVIDKSGSMSSASPDRMETVKAALLGSSSGTNKFYGLLEMMSQMDFVSVVTFSDEAEVIGGTGANSELLRRGTKSNIDELKREVGLISASGRTDFLAGFTKAFDVLKNSADAEITSNCRRVILFLTDGADTTCDPGCTDSTPASWKDGEVCKCQEKMLEQIETMQEGLGDERATIFTFSMGAAADNSIVRQIACQHGGSWAPIQDGDDPLVQMGAFFSFLAKSAKKGQVYWSEPYNDWSTSQMLTSASSPVFASDDWKQLIGVVSVDVPPNVLSQSAGVGNSEWTQLVEELHTRSMECTARTEIESETKPCERQMMRRAVDPVAVCPANVGDVLSCCFKAKGKTFWISDEPKTYAEADTYCKDKWQRLAVPNSDENLHLLAGMAPPDGAWLGLDKLSGSWKWADGSALATSDTKFWGDRDFSHDCGIINPRGSTANVGDADCEEEKRAFICETDATPAGGECAEGCMRANTNSTWDFFDEDANDKTSVSTPAVCEDSRESFVIDSCEGNTRASSTFCEAPAGRSWTGGRDQTLCCCGLGGLEDCVQGTGAASSLHPLLPALLVLAALPLLGAW